VLVVVALFVIVKKKGCVGGGLAIMNTPAQTHRKLSVRVQVWANWLMRIRRMVLLRLCAGRYKASVSTDAPIKHESLILAQNERWRQA
tara:strand:- start:228 stop:491 length:264 start_codon:yes stop_codon:yes gene_type:complete